MKSTCTKVPFLVLVGACCVLIAHTVEICKFDKCASEEDTALVQKGFELRHSHHSLEQDADIVSHARGFLTPDDDGNSEQSSQSAAPAIMLDGKPLTGLLTRERFAELKLNLPKLVHSGNTELLSSAATRALEAFNQTIEFSNRQAQIALEAMKAYVIQEESTLLPSVRASYKVLEHRASKLAEDIRRKSTEWAPMLQDVPADLRNGSEDLLEQVNSTVADHVAVTFRKNRQCLEASIASIRQQDLLDADAQAKELIGSMMKSKVARMREMIDQCHRTLVKRPDLLLEGNVTLNVIVATKMLEQIDALVTSEVRDLTDGWDTLRIKLDNHALMLEQAYEKCMAPGEAACKRVSDAVHRLRIACESLDYFPIDRLPALVQVQNEIDTVWAGVAAAKDNLISSTVTSKDSLEQELEVIVREIGEAYKSLGLTKKEQEELETAFKKADSEACSPAWGIGLLVALSVALGGH
eukprot:gnl/TRDRNA2_/TRDRNA2_37900_c0_seq1.p1 gnl/TRDRNA2_/TRDRNA2_37900_c0~~gnl/TRDRNA2_/TRDRNA2_37900_c0_seq1.p1  ORF type:complete len:468 (-),score=95.66 gnl/TRDRNA2_/TRDRNA2_37900_c0_seq1:82-1485(-)